MAIKLKIDGKDYEVDEGLSLLEACKSVGIRIPHFCYHPGLGPDGNCRMCQVEIITERGAQLVISCNTPARDGMVVETQSERARRVRAAVEEFLLLNHPLDCPICDKAGECTLQNYYMAHDRGDSFQEFPKIKKRKAVSLGETLVLDQERCILCDRCVRFLRDVAGSEELYIAGRGHKAYLTTFPGKEVTSPYSLNTVDLCPVGALTSKDFRFHSPAWFLKKTPSVCTTCSRGCSITIDHRDGKVYRLRPRYNPDVNGYWMCDEGRLNYKFVNEDRVESFVIRGDGAGVEVTRDEAIAGASSLLGSDSAGGSGITLLASASSTLEEMFLLKLLAEALPAGVSVQVVLHVPDGEEDDLLRRGDRHSNRKGAELLGIPVVDLRDGAGGSGLEDLAAGGTVLATGFDYGVSSGLRDILKKAGKLVLLAARDAGIAQQADVVFPSMTFAEKAGIVVNFEGRAQELHPANVGNNHVPSGFDLPARGVSQWRILADLLGALGEGRGAFDDIGSVRRAITEREPSFRGVDLVDMGDTGVTVRND
jgi:NADH-quinone oxidoreductase subunit G